MSQVLSLHLDAVRYMNFADIHYSTVEAETFLRPNDLNT
jgi:hypothetical protein